MIAPLILAAGVAAARGPICGFPKERIVAVADSAALTRALASALPGDMIRLADGKYPGRFTAAASGVPGVPVVVCGSRNAVLDGGSVKEGYGLHVTGSHLILSGFTVTRSKKGIMLDGASHVVLFALEVKEIGNEGVHFRAGSSDNILLGSYIHHTGRDGEPHFGEGVYIGSAVNHWCDISACGPDRSDRNQILNNLIGPGTTAESVDVKEGTTGGVLRGNRFDGDGMVADRGADSFVDVKGNDYVIEQNRGSDAPRDAFEVHMKAPGWGRGNRFSANDVDVGTGYVVRLLEGATGNVVYCDNVSRTARGVANVACAKTSRQRVAGERTVIDSVRP